MVGLISCINEETGRMSVQLGREHESGLDLKHMHNDVILPLSSEFKIGIIKYTFLQINFAVYF